MATRDTGDGQQRASRRSDETDEVEVEEQTGSDLKERHEKLSEDVDSLLDEIDDVLEENAEEFVKGYVQKGGQ
jgi:prokaryotic ubiquitin-like protein Pup